MHCNIAKDFSVDSLASAVRRNNLPLRQSRPKTIRAKLIWLVILNNCRKEGGQGVAMLELSINRILLR